MFARSFKDRMFGSFVVTKLYIWCGKDGSEQDWCYDGCPSFEEVNERL